jgi:hypothetical protein
MPADGRVTIPRKRDCQPGTIGGDLASNAEALPASKDPRDGGNPDGLDLHSIWYAASPDLSHQHFLIRYLFWRV